MKDDLISRKEAIDAVCMEWCGVKHQDCRYPFDEDRYDDEFCDGCETVLYTLPDLPAVQLAQDCISRKAALDALKRDEEYNEDIPNRADGVRDAIITIMGLPTVQPQRIGAKWVPVDSFSAFGGDEITWMAHGNPIAFYYCSNCKEQAYAGEDGQSLITNYCPHCGAYMQEDEG